MLSRKELQTMDHHLKRVAKFRKEIWELLESMGREFKSVDESAYGASIRSSSIKAMISSLLAG